MQPTDAGPGYYAPMEPTSSVYYSPPPSTSGASTSTTSLPPPSALVDSTRQQREITLRPTPPLASQPLTAEPPLPPLESVFLLRRQRLGELVKYRWDDLGEILSSIRRSISRRTEPLSAEIQTLEAVLRACRLPQELVNTHPDLSPKEIVAPIKNLNQRLGKTITSLSAESRTGRIRKGVRRLIQYYSRFLTDFETAGEQKRQQLLVPMAQLATDQEGFWLSDVETARKMLSIDCCGEKARENLLGLNAVSCEGGIHFKVNPKEGEGITPGVEHAAATFSQLFSKRQLVAAPTMLLKVRVPIQALSDEQENQKAHKQYKAMLAAGATSDKIFKENSELEQQLRFTPRIESRLVQASFTIGYPKRNRGQLTAISLKDLVEVHHALQFLITSLGDEELAKQWDDMVTTCRSEQEPPSPKELYEQYELFMTTKASSQRGPRVKRPSSERAAEFRLPGETLQRGDRQIPSFLSTEKSEGRLERFEQAYLRETDLRHWSSLLALLEKWPHLMQKQSLEVLVQIPKLLELAPKLMPELASQPNATTLKAFRTALNEVDPHSFSVLCLSTLLIGIEDGRSDNYMVTIERAKGKPPKFHLVSIDNDQAFIPPLTKQSQSHYLQHRCVLYGFHQLMNQPIDKDVRDLILNRDPRDLLLDWLERVDRRQQGYREMLAGRVLSKKEVTGDDSQGLKIPLQLPNGLLLKLRQKLGLIRQLLKENQSLTHNDLFKALERVTFECYQKLILRGAKTPLDLDWQLTHGGDPTTVEALLRGQLDEQLEEGGKTVKQLVKEAADTPQCRSYTEEGRALLSQIDLNQIAHPVLKMRLWRWISCLSFSDQAPQTPKEAQGYLKNACMMAWPRLAALCLRSGAKATYVDDAKQTPLHHLVRAASKNGERPDDVLACLDLILRDPKVDCNAKEQHGRTPVQCLISRAKDIPNLARRILQELTVKGANLWIRDDQDRSLIDAITDEIGRLNISQQRYVTPIDQLTSHEERAKAEAQRDRYRERKAAVVSFFHSLVEQGGGWGADPQRVRRFARDHAADFGVRAAYGTLLRHTPELAWMEALDAISTAQSPQGGQKPIKIEGARSGVRYLRPQLTAEWKRKKTPSSRGFMLRAPPSRVVFELHPQLPGLQYALSNLYERLFRHGASTVELFKYVESLGTVTPMLLSQSIAGDRLLSVLESRSGQAELAKLDCLRLHNMMIGAMLTNPREGSPRDYQVTAFTNHLGESRNQLTCIRHPLPFGRGQSKCVLFYLDAMKQPLHPKAKDWLLRLDPSATVKEWLTNLKQIEDNHLELFPIKDRKQLLAEEEHRSTLLVPIPEGTASNLVHNLTQIQRLLQRNERATPLDLLYLIDRDLGTHHAQILDQASSTLDRWTADGGDKRQKLSRQETLKALNISAELSLSKKKERAIDRELKSLAGLQTEEKKREQVKAALLDSNAKLLQAITQPAIRDDIVSSIDYSGRNGVHVLQAVIGARISYHHLAIKGGANLTDRLLRGLLARSPNLVSLGLHGCTKLTIGAIRDIKRLCPQLNVLKISGSPNLRHIDRHLEFPRLSRLTLNRCVNLQAINAPTPLLTALSVKNCPILSQLGFSPEKIQEADFTGCTKLPLKVMESFLAKARTLKRIGVDDCPLLRPYRLLIAARPSLMTCALSTLSQEFVSLIHELVMVPRRNLDLSEKASQPNEARAIAIALKGDQTATRLNLSSNRLGDQALLELADALRDNRSLHTLDLSQNDLTYGGAATLKNWLKGHPSLKKLIVSDNTIEKIGLDHIAKLALSCPQLTELAMDRCSIDGWGSYGGRGNIPSDRLLKQHPSLKVLSLAGNQIAGWASNLIQGIERNRELRVLDLSSNGLGRRASEIVRALAKRNRPIRLLLRDSYLDCFQIIEVAEALKAADCWQAIDLTGNPIEDVGAKSICQAVVSSQSLQELVLSNCKLTPAGISTAAILIAQNRSLVRLDLSRNHIDARAAAALGLAISKHPTLVELVLAGAQINSKGAKALAAKLTECAIRKLDLSNNQIDDQGIIALAQALQSCQSLTSLNLTNNPIGAEGVSALAKLLSTNQRLTQLAFDRKGLPASKDLTQIDTLLADRRRGRPPTVQRSKGKEGTGYSHVV